MTSTSTSSSGAESAHQHPGQNITVLVFAPSTIEPQKFTWPKTKRVGEAAKEAAAAFGASPENPTFQNAQGEVLDRNKPLVAAGVRDHDKLELVSAGGGVYMLAREATVAAVEAELPAMTAYAGRHGWQVSWMPDDLRIVCGGRHPANQSPLCLVADVVDYRAVPPAWTVHNAAAPSNGTIKCPESGSMPEGTASVFGPGVICAPFNRLAYKDHAGPHADWGGPLKWLDVRGTIHAYTLGDMLAVITAHLQHSPGWKA